MHQGRREARYAYQEYPPILHLRLLPHYRLTSDRVYDPRLLDQAA